MKILIIVPGADGTTVGGNVVTARRWEALLTQLGHRITIDQTYRGEETDLLVALHARKSAPAVAAFAAASKGKPLVVALTGTDLYGDLPENEDAQRSLELATHLIALQPGALSVLDAEARKKTTVIYQSAKPMPPISKAVNCFQACLLAHLRPVKDPFLSAEAASKLPASSAVQIVHAGEALDDESRGRALQLSETHRRYRWIGPLPHDEARLLIARSHLLLLTSRSEGGANVLSESIAIGVPVLASRVDGIVGLLGDDYPGLFPPGDASTLARALDRAERDEVFYGRLQKACEKLAPKVAPDLERKSWERLLALLR